MIIHSIGVAFRQARTRVHSQPSAPPTGAEPPGRQRSAVQRCADHLGFHLFAEASDLGVSARTTSPFERPALSPWLRRPHAYEAVVWSHADRAVRSVEHMTELIAWARRHGRTLAFGMPEDGVPLVVTPLAGGSVIRRCMELARDAQR
ncbi:recombinase family protein [Streptomyces olivaceoviridis]|uniref:recombinase family protein n=1 Tax=Streptomyces olivaceoviridis TaxID=1921 RepID=UPI0036902481